MKFYDARGATPLNPDDLLGLKLPTVQTQEELNIAEYDNVSRGRNWARKSRNIKTSLLQSKTLRELHRRMFGEVWRWAGQNRVVETSIGCAPEQIPERTETLLRDVQYWIEHKIFPPEEIGIRFHHQLVAIHIFRNGNGRHARLAGELLIRQLGGKPPTWGGDELQSESERRDEYLKSLREADKGNYAPLLHFSFKK